MMFCSALINLKRALRSRKKEKIEEAHQKLNAALAKKRKWRESLEAKGVIKDQGLDSPLLSEAAEKYGFKPHEKREAAEVVMGIRLPRSQDDNQVLAGQLSERIGPFKLRVVLWMSKAGLKLALFAVTSQGALCAHALMNMGLAACEHCGVLFHQTRTDKMYCCEAHGNAHRVARHRSKAL
jgi:hypothetical protein